MRMRRNRVKGFYLRKRISKKDSEGSTYEEWDAAIPFMGESWPASGKVQAQEYGERISYIQNIRIEGAYEIKADEKGMVAYDFGNGLTVQEADGICLYTGAEQQPDYKIIAIKPYKPLKLEVERI